MAKVEILFDYCKSCKLCINVCPKHVLHVGKAVNKSGYEPVEMKNDSDCIGCSFCALMCPEAAIEVYK
ncbi:MAG: 4Fe-4S dicluster domain-containing protein [Lachnospiraceae bacterium]|nr:4Fe-4S dicluster domain-containing protein [Lachnospiraceae bacterium]